MRKSVFLLLGLLSVACVLAACNAGGVNGGDPVESSSVIAPGESQRGEDMEIPFTSHVVRVGSDGELAQFPYHEMISSREDLQSFYEENKDAYGLDSTLSDESFASYMEKYDDAYFEENALLIVLQEVGSGSIRFSVDKVALEQGTVEVQISQIRPESEGMVGTDDMAQWAFFIEMDASYAAYPVNIEFN